MSSVARACAVLLTAFYLVTGNARELSILILDDGLSGTCNESQHLAVPSVFQLDTQGRIASSQGSVVAEACQPGLVWMSLAEKIIDGGMAQKVVFVKVSAETRKAKDFLAGGKTFDALSKVLDAAQEKKIRFDYAIWQQGGGDRDGDSSRYLMQLRAVVRFVNSKVRVQKWLVARYSGCAGDFDKKIEKMQRIFGGGYLYNVFPGANLNDLDGVYWTDACRLNQAGQEKLANLWLLGVEAAEITAKRVERETLLSLFK